MPKMIVVKSCRECPYGHLFEDMLDGYDQLYCDALDEDKGERYTGDFLTRCPLPDLKKGEQNGTE